MKKLLVMILFMLLLTGCSETSGSQDSNESNMFVCIQPSDLYHAYDVVYHKNTKVMYVVSHGANNLGTFTVLVNPDGTPMLYEESEE